MAELFVSPHFQSTFRRTEACLETPGSGVGYGRALQRHRTHLHLMQFEAWVGGSLPHVSLALHALPLALRSSCFIDIFGMSCEPFSGGLGAHPSCLSAVTCLACCKMKTPGQCGEQRTVLGFGGRGNSAGCYTFPETQFFILLERPCIQMTVVDFSDPQSF